MQKVNRPQGKWRNVALGSISLLVILVDQFSKTWIRANLSTGQTLFDAGFFQITRVHNTGAAFGIFSGHSFTLIIVALVGIVVLLLFAFFLYRRWPLVDTWLVKSSIGLILGGTIGNLVDRLRLGYVTDFIDFKVWPAFNIADSAVTIGVILIAYCIIRLSLVEKR